MSMSAQKGDLSAGERAVSALFGLAFSIVAFTAERRPFGAVCGVLAGGLLARAAAGRCGVKAALQERTAFREKSQAIDESLQETFPASDPPASRLPDEPPSNAEAKWAAARAAGRAPT